MQVVKMYTDGGCRGNPGPGGWGALLKYGEHLKEWKGYQPDTTNNQTELMASIQAVEVLNRSINVHITTVSQSVKNVVTKGLYGWKQQGWKTAANTLAKNKQI